MKTLGALLVTALATVAVTWTAPFQTSAAAGAAGCGSGANGSAGYAYAGFQATGVSSGVRATVAATRTPSVKVSSSTKGHSSRISPLN